MNTFGMLIILVFTTLIAHRECLRFEDNFDGFTDQIFVNNSETATIKFKYNPGQDKRVKINCGSLDADQKCTALVSKATLTSDWTTTGVLSGRVKVLKDSTDKNIIGFTISSVRKTDPSRYRCEGIYNDANKKLQAAVYSTVVTLTVLDPPKLEDCLLGNLPDKQVGGSVEIACYATGKPVPYLRCLLLDDDKKQLKQLSNSQTGNLTKGDWKFTQVPSEARYVQCIASHTQTGSTIITKPFQVLHAPPAVENFTQICSPVSSITFEWSPMSARDAGGVVTSYIIRYYPTKKGQVSSVRKELRSIPPTNDPDPFYKKNDDVYTYEISELTEYKEYKVFIAARNSNGEGETASKEMKTGYKQCLRFEDNFDGFTDQIFVNNSETATIKFKYNPGQDKRVKINCGSLDADQKCTALVSKATLTSDWTTTGVLSGRVKVLKDSTDKNIIGFTISSVRKTDPSRYRCEGIYNDANKKLQAAVYSTVVTLTVLDPPKLEDCLLGNLPDKQVGGSVEIACYATGKPVPYLRCLLLDDDKKQLKQLSNSQTGNLTKGDWKFTQVPSEARYVQCIASHTQTGSTIITKPFQVLHAPPAVENFTQICSPVSSITFEWSPMSARDAGGVVTSYIIRYYPTKKGQVSSVRKELRSIPPTNDPDPFYKKNDDVYTYEISELTEYKEYKVFIVARNSNGEGETTSKEMKTGYKPVTGGRTDGDDSNLAPIVGGVIGGVVLIILIVILIVWLSKRKSSTGESNYSKSYVENPVDHPLNQGNNVHAGVDNKQR